MTNGHSVHPVNTSIAEFDTLDTDRLSNGKYVWTWTSPGGAAHQGARQYTRAGDALRAGQKWLIERLGLGANGSRRS